MHCFFSKRLLFLQSQVPECYHLFSSRVKKYCHCHTKRFFIMSSTTEADQQKLNLVKDVDVDSKGRFKYILVKVYIDKGVSSDTTVDDDLFKYVVRGYATCEYHADIYDRLTASIKRIGGLDTECVGGGRILHENKKLTVFGYSQGYGKADHKISVEILKKYYPDYNISWSDEGY